MNKKSWIAKDRLFRPQLDSLLRFACSLECKGIKPLLASANISNKNKVLWTTLKAQKMYDPCTGNW